MNLQDCVLTAEQLSSIFYIDKKNYGPFIKRLSQNRGYTITERMCRPMLPRKTGEVSKKRAYVQAGSFLEKQERLPGAPCKADVRKTIFFPSLSPRREGKQVTDRNHCRRNVPLTTLLLIRILKGTGSNFQRELPQHTLLQASGLLM